MRKAGRQYGLVYLAGHQPGQSLVRKGQLWPAVQKRGGKRTKVQAVVFIGFLHLQTHFNACLHAHRHSHDCTGIPRRKQLLQGGYQGKLEPADRGEDPGVFGWEAGRGFGGQLYLARCGIRGRAQGKGRILHRLRRKGILRGKDSQNSGQFPAGIQRYCRCLYGKRPGCVVLCAGV